MVREGHVYLVSSRVSVLVEWKEIVLLIEEHVLVLAACMRTNKYMIVPENLLTSVRTSSVLKKTSSKESSNDFFQKFSNSKIDRQD